MAETVSNSVQSQVSFPCCFIASIIFKGKRIGKHIGSDQLTVSAIDISSGAFQDPFFGGSAFKFTDIIFPLDDLQIKKLADQNKRQQNKYNNKNSCSF